MIGRGRLIADAPVGELIAAVRSPQADELMALARGPARRGG